MSTKKPNRWTPDEDGLLREAVLEHKEEDINWHSVAQNTPGRNNKDCRKRWVYFLAQSSKKGSWSSEEDGKLTEGVKKHGYRWVLVSQVVGSRQPDQCSRRWHETINPNISYDRWSLLEDQTLLTAVQMHGRKWTEIVERYFYNKTPIAAKNRYDQRFLGTPGNVESVQEGLSPPQLIGDLSELPLHPGAGKRGTASNGNVEHSSMG